ncbi:acyl-CoA thioester hydrolase [Tamaricihabitans halophyticus]|uniref:Acyl-CoA thioester hydrolase n=1 Tax=Tamaricihabitans halophyticus TaxID=1262583 RepID=A0A4R2RBZ9_9PSEU|nr:thioesterase family protein [Tamaricihabitans halophyticus]TCP56955.1 acyl-CoA thioester hydrolase [Tamaricihabitans halophyticus]
MADVANKDGFVQRIEVRYGDCDMQGVVFNANYLGYVDHALANWFRHALGGNFLTEFDYMVKRVTLDWTAPAKAFDIVEATPFVGRWGRTSFDPRVIMRVGAQEIARADLVYVSVSPGTHEPTPVPEHVRAALS